MTLQSDFRKNKERTKLVEILLGFGDKVGDVPLKFSQRDLAYLGGTDWESAHNILISLCDEGAIRFDRNRMIVNKELLHKAAGNIEKL